MLFAKMVFIEVIVFFGIFTFIFGEFLNNQAPILSPNGIQSPQIAHGHFASAAPSTPHHNPLLQQQQFVDPHMAHHAAANAFANQFAFAHSQAHANAINANLMGPLITPYIPAPTGFNNFAPMGMTPTMSPGQGISPSGFYTTVSPGMQPTHRRSRGICIH